MAQSISLNQVQQSICSVRMCCTLLVFPGILLDYYVILLFSGDPQVGVVYVHHTPLDQSELLGKKSHKSHDMKVCT